MRRRDFLVFWWYGGVAAGGARAQPALPVIGFLNGGSQPDCAHLSGISSALSETGFVEGRNADIEFRWARGRYDRLPTLAAELV